MRRETFYRRLQQSADWKRARLGFLLGTLTSLLIAYSFSIDGMKIVEYPAIDFAFKFRSPNPPSPKLVLIGIDDNSIQSLGGQPDRLTYYKTLRALDMLGVRLVGLDITFDVVGRDPFTGELDPRLPSTERTGALAKGFELSGKVNVAFRCLVDENWRDQRELTDRLIEPFSRNLYATAAEIAATPGLRPAEIADVTERVEPYRDFCLSIAATRKLSASPTLSYAEFRALFPQVQPGEQEKSVAERILRTAYQSSRTLRRMAELQVPIRVTEFPPQTQEYRRVFAIEPSLLSLVTGGGCTMTFAHDADGVLRRAPLLVRVENEPYFYLGFALGLKTLEDETTRVEAVIDVTSITILLKDRVTNAVKRTMVIPLQKDGTTLANWVGTPGRWGHRGGPGVDYDQVPIAALVLYYNEACEKYAVNMALLARRLVEIDDGFDVSGLRPEYRGIDGALATWRAAPFDPKMDAAGLKSAESELRGACGAIESTYLESLAKVRKLQVARLPPARRPDFEAAFDAYEKDFHAVGRERTRLDAQLRPLIQGRTALVGTTASNLGDLHSTPMGIGQPGVDMHMAGANLVLTERFLRYAPKGWMVLMIFASGTIVAWCVTYMQAVRSTTISAICAGVVAVAYLGSFERSGVILSASPLVSIFAAYAASLLFRQLVTLKAQKQLQTELESKMSPAVVAQYMSKPDYFSQPRKVFATAFFSDIKGFTAISEKMSAQELITFINRYHDKMTQILMAHEAYIDKYIGDGIMALFGAPIEDERHALRACAAALKNVVATDELNRQFKAEGLPEVKIRIGLNTGEMVAAKVGSSARADLTAMGDTVNLASRLEGANKIYGSSVLISETTYELVKGQFEVRELDRIRVVGKQNAVRVYELLSQAGQPHRFNPDFMALYEQGLRAFKARRWREADDAFSQAMLIVPAEPASQLYRDRCYVNLIKEPPPGEQVFSLGAK